MSAPLHVAPHRGWLLRKYVPMRKGMLSIETVVRQPSAPELDAMVASLERLPQTPVASGWVKLAPEGHGFVVWMPRPPRTRGPAPSPKDRWIRETSWTVARRTLGDMKFDLWVTELPDVPPGRDVRKTLARQTKAMGEVDGREPAYQREIEIGEHPAVRIGFVFAAQGRDIERHYMLAIVGTRGFILGVSGLAGAIDTIDVERFFASFAPVTE